MTFIGQLLPLLVVAAIVALIVARLIGRRAPRAPKPAARPRAKRTTPLRMVKGAAMDRELTKLLREERPPRE
jgi:hypothetical protein